MIKNLLHNKVFCIAVAISIALHAIFLCVHITPPASIHVQKANLPIQIRVGQQVPFVMPSSEVVQPAEVIGSREEKVLASATNVESGTNKRMNSPQAIPQSDASVRARAGQESASVTSTQSRESHVASASEGGQSDSRSVVFKGGNSAARAHASGGSNGTVVITAATRDVGYTMYRKALRQRVERVGQINFPQRNGVRLYGELTVRIPLNYDGTLSEREGGPSIEQSSGNSALDVAALSIVRRAAPFGRLPDGHNGSSVWIIITRLRFAR